VPYEPDSGVGIVTSEAIPGNTVPEPSAAILLGGVLRLLGRGGGSGAV